MSGTHELIRETHIIGPASKEWIIHPGQEFADAGILAAGVSQADSKYEFVRFNTGYPQLLVCFAGKGEVWEGGRWRTCGAGSAYVTPTTATHAYHTIGGRPWHLAWVIYFAGPKCPISTTEPVIIQLDPMPIRDAILGLYRESISLKASAFMKTWIGLIQLYGERALHDSGTGDTLWPVWNLVSGNLSRGWTLASLAQAASISPEHLRRLCHRQLGCTPMQHVTRLRMNHAATMLTTTPQKIDAIAKGVGYANRFAFSHAFHRHFDKNPAAYRRIPSERETPSTR